MDIRLSGRLTSLRTLNLDRPSWFCHSARGDRADALVAHSFARKKYGITLQNWRNVAIKFVKLPRLPKKMANLTLREIIPLNCARTP
jgi:hypothetical protein